MQDHFKVLARYNSWANACLYEVSGKLSPHEYLKDRRAFFSSIHGTLNHLLVVDRLWLGRLEQRDSGITALNQILYTDFASLLQARQKEDENISKFIEELDFTKLTETIYFKTLAGKETGITLMWLLTHFFNHQTHHRGQVHNMLSQADCTPPAIDLYAFLLE